jgi:trehalose 6-phosphate phosphatase
MLQRRPRGLFSDIDGTISAIAQTPDDAVLVEGISTQLERAGAKFDVVAIVSGRSAQDAYRMVGLDRLIYFGNHGLERFIPGSGGALVQNDVAEHVEVLPAAQRYIATIDSAMDDIEHAIGSQFPGMQFEHKGATGTIHVRNTADRFAAKDALVPWLEYAGKQSGLRVFIGDYAAELRPPIAADKGTAITDLILTHQLKSAFYLGDDLTDIDAFRAIRKLSLDGICQGLAIAVVHEESLPAVVDEADLTISSCWTVPEFLHFVLTRLDAK